MKKALSLILLLTSLSSLHAKFRFGDQHAAIKIANGASLQIDNAVNIEGTVTKESGGTITGDGSLTFDEGVFLDEGAEISMTGSYDPGTNTISLDGNKQLIADTGTITALLSVSGANNVVKGQPTLSSDITLADSSSSLLLGLQSAMNYDLVLNDGSVTLTDDLHFNASKFVVGPGTLNTNTHKLYTGQGDLTADTDLLLGSTSSIVLNAPLTLSGIWSCSGAVTINGNGLPFNLSTGRIVVSSGATVTLADMQLKNWSTNSIQIASGGTLVLSNVRSDFAASITYSAGTIKVVGDSTFILKTSVLTFSGSSSLTVDGAQFSYDTTTYEFASLNAANIVSLNGGELIDMNGGAGSGPLDVSESTTVTNTVSLDPFNRMTFDPPSAATITVNYSGHKIEFSSSTSKQVDVKNGADAVITNADIKNFVPAAVVIDETSSLTFGDNTTIELGSNQTATFPLTFSGTTLLDGQGYTLTISETNKICAAADTTLTLKNVVLAGVSGDALCAMAATSKLICENVTCMLADDAAISTGSWEVKNGVTIIGAKRFTHSTNAALTIKEYSSLTVSSGATFVYDPADDNVNGIQFTDSTAELILNNSIFEVTSTGVLLTKGTVSINNTSTFKSLATDLSGAILLGDGANANNNVAVKVGGGATFVVSGGVMHIRDAA